MLKTWDAMDAGLQRSVLFWLTERINAHQRHQGQRTVIGAVQALTDNHQDSMRDFLASSDAHEVSIPPYANYEPPSESQQDDDVFPGSRFTPANSQALTLVDDLPGRAEESEISFSEMLNMPPISPRRFRSSPPPPPGRRASTTVRPSTPTPASRSPTEDNVEER